MDEIEMTINGRPVRGCVEPRTTLLDFLRDRVGLTGTHDGCEEGACGACTVMFEGATARSCVVLAMQAEGSEITTIEGVAAGGELHPVQQALHDHHGLQCGFCTPGMVLSAIELLDTMPDVDRDTIVQRMSGNLCRCTGYTTIIDAIEAAAKAIAATTGVGHAG